MTERGDLTKREREVLTLAVQGYDDESIARQLGISGRTVADHISRIKRKLQGPLPGLLDKLGLLVALRLRIATINRDEWPVPARRTLLVTMDAPADLGSVARPVQSIIYRIVDEALTDLALLTNASRCSVRIVRNEKTIVLTVEYDGRDIPDDRFLGGKLPSIRESVQALGGVLTIESLGKTGIRIVTELPVLRDPFA
jgi:signal transduction histidine kinase